MEALAPVVATGGTVQSLAVVRALAEAQERGEREDDEGREQGDPAGRTIAHARPGEQQPHHADERRASRKRGTPRPGGMRKAA